MNITASRVCNILTPTEVALFEVNYEPLSAEYKDKGTISLESVIPILGNPPVIPDTHDLDSICMAYEERAEYGRKLKEIESLLKTS